MGEQSLSHKQRALSLDCLWGPTINAYQKVNTKRIGWLAGTGDTELLLSWGPFFVSLWHRAHCVLLSQHTWPFCPTRPRVSIFKRVNGTVFLPLSGAHFCLIIWTGYCLHRYSMWREGVVAYYAVCIAVIVATAFSSGHFGLENQIFDHDNAWCNSFNCRSSTRGWALITCNSLNQAFVKNL